MCRWCSVDTGCSCNERRRLDRLKHRAQTAAELWADGLPHEDMGSLLMQIDEATADFEATEEQRVAAAAWILRLPPGDARTARQRRLASATARAASRQVTG